MDQFKVLIQIKKTICECKDFLIKWNEYRTKTNQRCYNIFYNFLGANLFSNKNPISKVQIFLWPFEK